MPVDPRSGAARPRHRCAGDAYPASRRDAAALRGTHRRHGAARLRASGVPVEISRRAGMNHGFMFWVGLVGGADAAMADACAWACRGLRGERTNG